MTIPTRLVRPGALVGFLAALATAPAFADGRASDALAAMPFDYYTSAIAVADFDGDGRPDVAMASTPGLDVRLTRRDDWQAWEETRASGVFGLSLAAADLDRDGDADLVMGGTEVRVFWGDGLAGFVEALLTRGPSETFDDLALADMNGDGLLDVVASGSSRGLHVILQDRAAPSGFAPPSIYPFVESLPGTRLAVADFDRDGASDVALVSANGRVAYGDGVGGFTRVVSPGNLSGNVVAALDYDSDGRVDLAVGSFQSVHFHRNDPATSSFVLARAVHVGEGDFTELGSGDFDHDGLPDLLIGYASIGASSGLHVLYGRRRVPGSRPLDSLLRSILPADSAVVDFDRDGFVDAVALVRGGFVAVARGGASGLRVPALAPAADAAQLDTADFDGDGRLDMAVGVGVSSFERDLRVLRLDASGRLATISLAPMRNPPTFVSAGDFDSDGRPDLVISSRFGNSVALLMGSDAGLVDTGDVLAASAPNAPLVVDFDADGSADVLVGAAGELSVLLGDGSGAFPTRLSYAVASETLRAGDVDEDGLADVVFRNPSSGRHILIHGDAAGLRPPIELALPAGVGSLVGMADVDEDGHVDLVFGQTFLSRSLDVLFGDGASGFPRRASIPLAESTGYVLLADFDADGHVDFANHSNAVLATYRGDGFGGFSKIASCALSGIPIAADFVGDDRRELASADSYGDAVSVILPRGFDPREALVGSVNRRFDSPASVLFVNDSAGGVDRRLRLLPFEPIVAFMASPPRAAGGGVPFALYAWEGPPATGTARSLPLGLGTIAMPPPFLGGFPRAIWNSTNRPNLGAPTAASSPLAPGIVFRKPAGAGRAITFTLQGIIADPGSRGERPASVTNGLVIEVR